MSSPTPDSQKRRGTPTLVGTFVRVAELHGGGQMRRESVAPSRAALEGSEEAPWLA